MCSTQVVLATQITLNRIRLLSPNTIIVLIVKQKLPVYVGHIVDLDPQTYEEEA